MASFPTGAFTAPIVLAPIAVDSWSALTLTLDVVLLPTTMRLFIEHSVDGITWASVLGETGASVAVNPRTGLLRTREEFSARWDRVWPPGFVRITVGGPTPWVCAGGQLDLT